MKYFIKRLVAGKTAHRVGAASLAVAISLASLNLAASGAPDAPAPSAQAQYQQQQQQLQQLQNKQSQSQSQSQKKFDLSRMSAQDRQDIILVLPNASADQDELDAAIKENKGTVIGTMGTGLMQVLIVKVERGQAEKVEKKFQADKKNFNLVNANHTETSQALIPKDPGFSAVGAWHFDRMHLPEAWEARQNANVQRLQGMVIMDSGCESNDVARIGYGANVSGEFKKQAVGLYAKMLLNANVGKHLNYIIGKGNYINTLSYNFSDRNGHGTWVSSAAAGLANTTGSIGVNPWIQIIPITIADGPYNTKISTDDLAMVAAMMSVFDTSDAKVNNIRIINVSYSNMFDEKKHPILLAMFKYWHDQKNGLVFVSAGNDGRVLSASDKPYVHVVSAMGHVKGMKLANIKASSGKTPWKSASGGCVHFTAPGEDIQVTDIGGMNTSVDGTSFSSPIVAGVASLIWAVKPDMKNTQLEDILKRSCVNVTSGRNNDFGWGMPDAAKAVQMAINAR